MCEAELHCFKGYTRLHYSDYYASDLSIIVTIWAMTGIKEPLKHLIYLAIAMMLQFAVMETTRSSYHFFLNLIFSSLPLGYLTFVYVSYIFGNILYCSLYCASIYIYYIIYLTIRQPSGVVGYKQI